MKKIALVVLVCLITLTVFRYSVGNNRPITDALLDVEFDDVGEIMQRLRLSVAYLSIVTQAKEDRLEELIESYQGYGGAWIRVFANKLPGIFSNTKEALYAISNSSWVNGNETWAVVQGHLAYGIEVFSASLASIHLGGELIRASAGKLVEIVSILLFR